MRLQGFIFLLVIFLFACGASKKMTSKQYLSWYESANNPLQNIDSNTNDFKAYLKELTPEYMASICLEKSCLPKDTIKKILKEPQGTLDFQLKYELTEKDMFNYNYRSEVHSSERMQYYSFDFKKDIKLITNANDTIDCVSLLFERSLPDSPFGIFEFSFPYLDIKFISRIEIRNRALTNAVTVFSLNKNRADLPKLKIK